MPHHYAEPSLIDAKYEEMMGGLGSGLYDLVASEQPAPAPAAPSGPSFWDRLGSGLMDVIAGPPNPNLSPAQNAHVRNNSLIRSGLYSILADDSNGPLSALAEGALAGQDYAAGEGDRILREQAAAEGPGASFCDAVRRGDSAMARELAPLNMTRGIDTGQGTFVGSDAGGFQIVPDPLNPAREIIQTPDGRALIVDKNTQTARVVDESNNTDWIVREQNDGSTLLIDPEDPNRTNLVPGGSEIAAVPGEGFFRINHQNGNVTPIYAFANRGEEVDAMRAVREGYASEGEYDKAGDAAESFRNIIRNSNPGFGDQTGANQNVVVVNFVQLADPGVSARFAETEQIANLKSRLQRVQSWFDRNINVEARFLTDDGVSALRQAAIIMATTYADSLDEGIVPIWSHIAESGDLDPQMLIDNPVRRVLTNDVSPDELAEVTQLSQNIAIVDQNLDDVIEQFNIDLSAIEGIDLRR